MSRKSRDTGLDDHAEVESNCAEDLRAQLHHNLASLFLKMQTVLHVSKMAIQEIVGNLNQIFSLSQPLIKKTIREVLQNHAIVVTETSVDEIISAVMDGNTVASATAKGEALSMTKRQKTFVENNFPVVRPVQYELEPGHTTVHISILEMIQEMFRHIDILEKICETKTTRSLHEPSRWIIFQK